MAAYTLREAQRSAQSRHLVHARYAHSTVIIGNRLYLWGGYQSDLPTIHDSPEKTRFSSCVDILHLDTGKWERKVTRGTPPLGVYGYACARGNKGSIVFFGGYCGHDLCFHNDLTELSTDTYTWHNIAPSTEYGNGPMRKSYCGMIPMSDNEGWAGFLIVGGNGQMPNARQPRADYYPLQEGRIATNEQHLYFNRWVTPRVTGGYPPPCTAFTFSSLPHNRGVMFGGLTVGGPCNDVYVAELMTAADLQYGAATDTIQWEKVSMNQSIYQLPEARRAHAGVVLGHQVLLVVGGRDRNNETISDCWLLDLTTRVWKRLPLSESVANRCYCSASCLIKSSTCVWLVLFGGTKGKTGVSQHLRDVQIVELQLGADGQWSKEKSNIGDLPTYKLTPEINTKNLKPQLSLMPLNAKDQQIARLMQELDQSRATVEKLQHEVEKLHSEREAVRQELRQLELARECGRTQAGQNKKDQYHWVVSVDEIKMTDTKLGDGAFGTVRVAEFRGLRVAAKLLHKLIQSESSYYRDIFSREMDIASKLRHPNLLQFIGATIEGTPIIITELMPTSLYQVIRDRHIARSEIISIGCDIALAMNYLHLWKPDPILHRDVSSPNVLLDHAMPTGWKAKLGDFGSANLQSHTRTDMPGNAYYAAPEARHPDDHSPAMDVYSFGVLMTEMTLCQPPGFTVSERESQSCSVQWPAMRSLVCSCTARGRHNRPHISRVLELLSKMDSS